MIAIFCMFLGYIVFAFYILIKKAPQCRLTEKEIAEGRKIEFIPER